MVAERRSSASPKDHAVALAASPSKTRRPAGGQPAQPPQQPAIQATPQAGQNTPMAPEDKVPAAATHAPGGASTARPVSETTAAESEDRQNGKGGLCSPKLGSPCNAGGATDDSRRITRREKRKRELTDAQNWELRRKLADITGELEVLAQEAALLRYYWACPSSLVTVMDLPENEQAKLKTAHERRLADVLFRSCSAVVKHIMMHKWAFPFNQPVDTNLYTDYLRVVATPMDMGTIKAKLEGRQYCHPDQCGDDVLMVFANAKSYNPPGSDVYIMADTLESKFKEKWEQVVVPKLGDERITCANEEMLAKKKLLEAQQQQVLQQLDRQRAAVLQRLDDLSLRCSDAKSHAAAACQPLTHSEKDVLTRQLSVLPQQHFETAMSLVFAHHPDLLPHGSNGETVVNVDHMDALTLRQLQGFISWALQEQGAQEAGEGEAQGEAGQGGRAPPRDRQQTGWPGLAIGTGRPMFRPPDAGRSAAVDAGAVSQRRAGGSAAPSPQPSGNNQQQQSLQGAGLASDIVMGAAAADEGVQQRPPMAGAGKGHMGVPGAYASSLGGAAAAQDAAVSSAEDALVGAGGATAAGAL